jgi:hypothetical protein
MFLMEGCWQVYRKTVFCYGSWQLWQLLTGGHYLWLVAYGVVVKKAGCSA